jgi:hypothetical protein
MSNLMHYEHQDFLANPKKYELFKTATTTAHFFGENGNDVPKGTIVGLECLGVKRNPLYRRDEPIYKLNTGHVVFANSLHQFVL